MPLNFARKSLNHGDKTGSSAKVYIKNRFYRILLRHVESDSRIWYVESNSAQNSVSGNTVVG